MKYYTFRRVKEAMGKGSLTSLFFQHLLASKYLAFLFILVVLLISVALISDGLHSPTLDLPIEASAVESQRTKHRVTNALFKEVQKTGTSSQSFQGTIRVFHEDYPDEGRSKDTVNLITDRGESFSIEGSNIRQGQFADGETVRIRGKIVGGKIFAESITARPRVGLSLRNVRPLVQQQYSAARRRNVHVVLANFSDNTPIFLKEEAEGQVFGDVDSVKAYYEEVSFGRLQLTERRRDTNTYGWYTLPVLSSAECDVFKWIKMAEEMARIDGMVIEPGDVVIYALADNSCQWGGIGVRVGIDTGVNSGPTSNTSETYNVALVKGGNSFKTGLVIHEIGHTLGLGHSTSLDCVNNRGIPISYVHSRRSLCLEDEYGDVFDPMGSGGIDGHLNIVHKYDAGFIESVNIEEVEQGGLYRIDDITRYSQGVQGLKIPLVYEPTPNGGYVPARYLFIEYREEGSFEDNSGVLFHVDAGLTSAPWKNTSILDLHPQTETLQDAMLRTGENFEFSGLVIRVQESGNGYALLDIEVENYAPCYIGQMNVSIDNATQGVFVGSPPTTYNMSVQASNSISCGLVDVTPVIGFIPNDLVVTNSFGGTFDQMTSFSLLGDLPGQFSVTISPGVNTEMETSRLLLFFMVEGVIVAEQEIYWTLFEDSSPQGFGRDPNL